MQYYNDLTGEKCFPTCLATLLGVNPNKLPHFYKDKIPIEMSWMMIQCHLRQNYHCDVEYITNGIPIGWAIAHGHGHACLAFNGKIMHDPTPGGQGLDHIDGYTILVDW